MAKPMSKVEREAFLKEPRPAILSIPQRGKGPLSTPVWYDYEPGGVLWILMQQDSRKGGLIEVGSRISVCVQKESRPYKYVTIEGPVDSIVHYALETDLRSMADRYLGRAGGAEFIEAMRDRFAQGNGIKVIMTPEAWLSADYDKT
jgi:hypothetical protein